MVVNKFGKKGRKKKAPQSEEGLCTQRRAEVEKCKTIPNELSSSESSDKDSEFLEDDSILDFDSKSKSMKQKKRRSQLGFTNEY